MSAPKVILWRAVLVVVPLAIALGISEAARKLQPAAERIFDRLDAWGRGQS